MYDGEAGDSVTSSNCGVVGAGVYGPVWTKGSDTTGSGVGLNGCWILG